jgi:hypothetical protein
MFKQSLIIVLIIALFVSGCGGANPKGAEPNANNGNNNTNRQGQMGVLNNGGGNAVQPLATGQPTPKKSRSLTIVSNEEQREQVQTYQLKGKTYVPLSRTLKQLNFNVNEENDFVRAGFTDPYIEVMKNSNHATVEGNVLVLSEPVVTVGDQAYITTDALEQILGDEATVNTKGQQLIFNIPYENEDYGFPEDESLDGLTLEDGEGPLNIPTVSGSTADSIISLGRRFMGTPYVFGSPAGYTRTFDCSTFTQYVYGRHGIDLPRLSRSQAKLGKYVRVKDLKEGDLLFFYWPGRFKSNRIVGHVGIYAGNGYMIHSAPNTAFSTDGVQVTNLRTNDAFKATYLGAKRIGS